MNDDLNVQAELTPLERDVLTFIAQHRDGVLHESVLEHFGAAPRLDQDMQLSDEIHLGAVAGAIAKLYLTQEITWQDGVLKKKG